MRLAGTRGAAGSWRRAGAGPGGGQVAQSLTAVRSPRPAPSSAPLLHPPTPDVAGILAAVHRRIVLLPQRRGFLSVEPAGDVQDPPHGRGTRARLCHAASVQRLVALGSHAGHYVSRLGADFPAGPAGAPPRRVPAARCRGRLDGSRGRTGRRRPPPSPGPAPPGRQDVPCRKLRAAGPHARSPHDPPDLLCSG
jgi:hypothetical protein